MDSRLEEMLVQCIDESLARLSFKRIDSVPRIDVAEIVAAWKRKRLSTNRAVAVLRFDNSDAHPGDFARRLKKPLGKALGYLPFFYELGLQLVLVGRDFLHRASGIERFVDTVNTQTVILQSIHLVETALLGSMETAQSLDLAVAETPGLPGWTKGLEALIRIKNPAFQFEPGKIHAHCCAKGASMSVSTWGLNPTRPIIDAIESGITRFLGEG